MSELIIVSDSRLSEGPDTHWDAAPKVFRLPRTDMAMAFYGHTSLMYPIAFQIIRALESNPAQAQRRYDASQAAEYIEKIVNQMLDGRQVEQLLREEDRSERAASGLVVGGYSWRESKFMAWEYRLNPKVAQFKRNRIADLSRPHFAGDVSSAARAIWARRADQPDHLDFEPLEIIRDMIRSGNHRSIGGSPQLIKVHRHMNSEIFGIEWSKDGIEDTTATYAGRPLLRHEKKFYVMINPDEPAIHARASRHSDPETNSAQLGH